ncbi:MAG: DNA-binding response OmpR family regulator [Planctomycetota bacterium]|jgi:DNA-binding response OmpR family regulator
MSVQEVPADWRGQGTVLVVDDDTRVATVISKMLALIGFEHVVVHDGLQAIELFRDRCSELTAVILDLTMPGMSGEEVLGELNGIEPSVPVILTSGYSKPDDHGGLHAGFLQKPTRLADIRECMRTVLDRQQRGPAARASSAGQQREQ